MITKYDTVQDNIYMYIWNRMTASPDLEERALALEITTRFPTWVGFSDVKPDMQTELVLWLIRQAKFYRQTVTVKLRQETLRTAQFMSKIGEE